MKKGITKVNCSWCGREIECPEDMLNAEKHGCFECFKKLEEGKIKIENPEKVHFDIPSEELATKVAEIYCEKAFPEIWNQNKKELKELSKKELAETMFRLGIEVAISESLNSEKYSEENKETRVEKETEDAS